jgi:hypothetical protein
VRGRPWTRDLLALAVLGAAVIAYQASVISGKRSLFAFPDNSVQTYAWYTFAARDGAVWDPYQFGGHTFLGEIQTALFYPLNQLLFAVTGDSVTGRGLTAFLIAHILLAAVFTYGFLRSLGIVRAGSVFGAIAFATGGYMSHRLPSQANIFVSAAWVPAVFWAFNVALQRSRWWLLAAGGALGMTLLAGHIQPAAYTVIALFLYAGWWVVSERGRRRAAAARAVTVFAGTLALGVALAAVQLVPAYEYQAESVRFINAPAPVAGDAKLPYDVVGHKFLLEPEQVDAFVSPGFAAVEDGSPYIGLLTLVLAAVGLVRAPRRWAVFWGGLALLALLYSMGHHAGVHRVAYEVVPLLDRIREPVRALMVVHLALAVLAAYGVAALADPAARWRWRRAAPLAGRVALWAVLAAAALYVAVKAVDGDPLATDEQRWRLAAALAVVGVGAVAGRALGWLAAPATAALCVVVLVLDLAPAGQALIGEEANYDGKGNVEPHQYYREDDVISFLKQHGGDGRVSVPGDAIPKNSGDVHGFEMLQGHAATMTRELNALLSLSGGTPSRGHDLMSVRYAVVNSPVDGWPQVLSAGGDLVHENRGALPRAWFAKGWEVEPDWRKALERTLDERFAHRERVVLDTEPRAGPPAEGAFVARVVRREPTEVEIETRTTADTVLVTSDLYYPGWSAEVDGDERRVLRADGFLRAVEVPAGEHTVTMSYRPTHWTAAVLLSGTAVLAIVAGGAVALVRRRRSS